MNIDEILTGTIGFIIAMALVGAAIAGIIYGYYIYAQHQTLENYLWPIAEAVPAKGGGYYLAVINTGQEPFIIKYLIYPNGQSQPVHTKPLYHNQYWLVKLDQLPAEVMVCSAVDPKVCTTAPVHGWYVVNTNATTLTGPNNAGENQVIVIVNDPNNAGWQVNWHDTAGAASGSQSGSTSTGWVIGNLPSNDEVNLWATLTSTPSGYSCTITPQSTTATPGQVVLFNINCQQQQSQPPSPPPTGSITVTVTNDSLGATWQVSWSDSQGVVSGSQSGSSDYSWVISNVPSNDVVYLTAQITSNPSGYTCSITPTTTSAQAGGSVTFTVDCISTQQSGTITVTVIDNYGAGWSVTWSGSASGSNSGSGNDTWTITASGTVNFQASITNTPTGYSTCSISPSTTSASPGQPVTFTVTCQVETGSINVSVNDTYNAGWKITWTDTKGVVSGSQSNSSSYSWTISNVPYGDTVTFQASITSTPSGYASCSINPQSTTAQMGQSVTFTVNCTQSTTQTGSITVSVTNDTLGATWEVQWSDSQGVVSGSQANTTDQTWVIKNVPYGDTVTLTATIVSNPSGYACSITPSQTTAQAGDTVTFTLNCVIKTGTISVKVANDTLGAAWQVTWSDTQGVVSGSQSGSGNSQWTITNVPYTDTVTLNAEITQNPMGYSCTISPTSTTAQAGQSITFTVSCTVVTGSISVSVTNDSLGATWLVTWSDSQGVVSGNQSGSTDQSWTVNNVPYGDKVTFQAQIVSNPSSYSCTISPTSQTAQMGGSVTFTVSCTLITGPINVEVTNDVYGATWKVTWTDTMGVVSGSKTGSSSTSWTINNVPSGDVVSFQASITQSPSGLSCAIEPQSTSAQMGQTVIFTVNCTAPQNAVLVVVNDTYGAGWEIGWFGATSGDKFGSSSTTFLIQTTGQITLEAWITANTNGYASCTISPNKTTANPGQTVTFNVDCTGPRGGYVIVNVIDNYGAGWQIQYSDYLSELGTHTVTGDTSYTWAIKLPYGDDLVFYSSITSVPSGYTSCGIYPIQTTAGPLRNGENQTVTFTVICSTLPPIKVTVNDNYGAGWLVTWSGVVSGNFSWTYSDSWIVVVPTNSAEVFTAKIISTPSGYSSCSISPGQTTAYPGQSITFNVNCQQPSSGGGGGGSNSISVSVTNDTLGATWSVTWSGAASGSKTGSSDASWTVNASGTVNFQASITQNPSGYTCTISPGSTSAKPGQSVTFTVNCYSGSSSPPGNNNQQCTYTYPVTISTNEPTQGSIVSQTPSCTGPGSANVNSNGGSVGTFSCQAPLSIEDSAGDIFDFNSWSVNPSPSGYAWSGTTTQSDFNAPLYCPAPASVTVSSTASYTFAGCSSYTVEFTITPSGSGTATFEWQFCPLDSATSWSPSWSANGNNVKITVTVYANFGEGGNYFVINNVCQYGVKNVTFNPDGGPASGSSGSESFTITIQCKDPPGN